MRLELVFIEIPFLLIFGPYLSPNPSNKLGQRILKFHQNETKKYFYARIVDVVSRDWERILRAWQSILKAFISPLYLIKVNISQFIIHKIMGNDHGIQQDFT